MDKVIQSLFFVALLVGPITTSAQVFAEYYTVQHPDEFHIDWENFYRNATNLTEGVREQLPNHLDLSYGSHPKQSLDLYLPKGEVDNAPVHLFIHGGGKREGDKAHYGFVAPPFAARGIITAVASYRLFGSGEEVVYPAQEDDIKQAVIWIYRNIARYGGNPRQIIISGHSNGAHLAARVGVDRSWLVAAGIPNTIIKAIAPLSGGSPDITDAAQGSVADLYAPTDEAKIMASPIYHVNDPAPEVLLQYGEKEATEERVEGIRRLANALRAKAVEVTVLVEKEHDHDGTVMVLGDENSATVGHILGMIGRSRTQQH